MSKLFNQDTIFVNLIRPPDQLYGLSGSPVFDLQGRVIGIFSTGVGRRKDSDSDRLLSVKLDILQKFVKEGAVLNCRDFSCVEEEFNNLIRLAKGDNLEAQWILMGY